MFGFGKDRLSLKKVDLSICNQSIDNNSNFLDKYKNCFLNLYRYSVNYPLYSLSNFNLDFLLTVQFRIIKKFKSASACT